MVTLAKIRAHLEQILHLHESPRRTALAFALGVFIAFSPTYGLHTISVIVCAWAFRLNVVALMAGAFINNPWTLLPILAATFWTGFQFLGTPAAGAFQWDRLTLDTFMDQIQAYAAPFFLGGVFLSLLGALLAYPAAYWIIAQARARRRLQTQEAIPPVATRNPPELR